MVGFRLVMTRCQAVRGTSRRGIRPSLPPGGRRRRRLTDSRYGPSPRLVRRAQERSRCSGDFFRGLLATLLPLLLLSACAAPDSDPSNDGRLRIAFISKSYTDPFWLDAIDGAERAAEKLGVELLTHAAKDETHVVEQVQIVENMIQIGVDGIVLAPCDSNALAPAVLKANQAGIPVTVIDTGIREGDIVTFAATDNVLCGAMAADRLADRLSTGGKVGVIACPPSILPCREILSGFVEGLREYPALELVGSPLGVPFCDQSFNATTDLLTAHPDLAGLYIFGGPAVLCAAQAAGAFGRDLTVVGRGSIGRAGLGELQAVKRGELDAIVAQFPARMGYSGIDSVVKFRRGIESPPFTDTGVVLVTKENVDEFIRQIESGESLL